MCGFIGVVGVPNAAAALGMGLQAIQHRGQDAAGVGVFDGTSLHIHKDVGRVEKVLTDDAIGTLPGASGIGHVRYPTVGTANTRVDAQPFMTRRPGLLLAHNGQVTNLVALARHLSSRGIHSTSSCDSEPILLVLADELLRHGVTGFTRDQVEESVGRTIDRVEGSYTVVGMMEIDGVQTLITFRDAHGFRPGVYGQRSDGSWVAASESVSLDVLEARIVGHVPAGGVVFMAPGEDADVRVVRSAPHHHCVFEDIYFARPDSVLETGRVYTLRQRLGVKLAERWKSKGLEADVVVAVPDTSRPAAQSMSEVLGIPNREGFIKNRYSGRTFIMPDQATRETAMRLKLNPIEEIFSGQRVLIVDDSIVRGTTMRRILSMVRGLGPKALHVAIFSPPVQHPCFYGIDMPTREELVASGVGDTLERLEAALAERLGADSVTFLPSPSLADVAGDRLCTACFTGEYPVAVADEEQGFIVRERRPMGVA